MTACQNRLVLNKRNKMKMVAVEQLIYSKTVTVMGIKTELKMTWAKGMIGVMPVFESKKAAKEYDPKATSIELTKVGK